jgi:hypothetical protein
MEIIQTTRKGMYKDNLDKYHISYTHRQNKEMNELLFDLKNLIFEVVYNHYTNQ